MGKRFKLKELSLMGMVVLLCCVFSFNNPVFFTFENLTDILKGNVVLIILAMGMTLVIISGGIDVSVAAMTVSIEVMIGQLFKVLPDSPASIILIFLAAAGMGIVLGSINGLLVAKVKIPPIVVTLGTMSIMNGMVLFLTNGVYMNSSNFPKIFIRFSNFNLFGISILIYLMLFAVVLTWYCLKYTYLGRSVYAIGGNSQSAQRIGINLSGVQIFVYGYMGFLAGIAAVCLASYTKAVDPNGMLGVEFSVIAAVVIGGANILGGNGSVWHSLLGALLLALMANGLILSHIDTFWQKIVIGCVILLAVSYDQMQRKRSDGRIAKIEVQA
jgi:simple sugar transport system permease protein